MGIFSRNKKPDPWRYQERVTTGLKENEAKFLLGQIASLVEKRERILKRAMGRYYQKGAKWSMGVFNRSYLELLSPRFPDANQIRIACRIDGIGLVVFMESLPGHKKVRPLDITIEKYSDKDLKNLAMTVAGWIEQNVKIV